MGIDVYHGNGNIIMDQLPALGHAFVIAKVSQGLAPDPMFLTYCHQAAALENKLRFGAYHYYDPKADFAGTIQKLRQTILASDYLMLHNRLVMALDLEEPVPNGMPLSLYQSNVKTLLDVMQQEFNDDKPPMIYGSPSFLEQVLTEDFSHYPLWIAHYNVNQPKLPKFWQTWEIWQYSDSGILPCVQYNPVDLNRLNKQGYTNIAV